MQFFDSQFMSDTEQRLTQGMQIGDYSLKKLIYEGPTTRTWLAEQISVNREVIIDSLNRSVQADCDIVDTFLSDVRTKAKVDHPVIGSVFEAVREDNICFYTREKMRGESLHDMIHHETQLTPEEVVHILKQIAEANLYLESHNVASLPLVPNQVYVSSTKMCRLINMAVGGARDHSVSTEDKVMLGNTFMKIIKKDAPGATRTQSLLNYMADKDREIPLTWEQIKDLSDGVERQLLEPVQPVDLNSRTMLLTKLAHSKRIIMSIGIALGLLIAGGFAYLFVNREKPPKKRELEGEVFIKAKTYQVFDKVKTKLRAFVIDSHEVTIAEYAAFLNEIEKLEGSRFDTFQHENHPAYKDSHEPDDWENLYRAAKKGEMWNDLKVTLNHPVIGIDWWDAYAYASYYNRRLPTQAEWFAAIISSKTKPRTLVVSSWGPVDQQSNDITQNQIFGMAGNVSEWTLKMTKPTHDPTAVTKRPVICGAAYNDSLDGALKREWVLPLEGMIDARDIRRVNLGFRTVAQPDSE